jgi:hypothetical protein
MRKLILIGLFALAFAVPASAAPVVPIVMKDPGCHWFSVHGKFATHYVAHGAVSVQNLDQAALRFVGPGGTHVLAVGKTIGLKTKGTYHITMVGQAKDDNHLVLILT